MDYNMSQEQEAILLKKTTDSDLSFYAKKSVEGKGEETIIEYAFPMG